MNLITVPLKKVAYYVLTRAKQFLAESLEKLVDNELEKKMITNGIKNYICFAYRDFKMSVLNYTESMKVDNAFSYKFAASSTEPTLYASMYACLIQSLFGNLNKEGKEYKKEWANFFDSFQDENNGFFYDGMINSPLYRESDWWGARHLVPHLIMAYNALGYKPQNQFKWVSNYYGKDAIDNLISEADWNSAMMDDVDIDNKIMNIGVTLQYQRDYFDDEDAGKTIAYLKKCLISKINPETGMWGVYDISNSEERARMIQFSYHLFRLFFYDDDIIANPNRIIDLIIESQNSYGGFATNLNSSACADIDAVNPLIYLSKQTDYRHDDIEKALRRAFIFILGNQNDDGGFVFFRDLDFFYGDKQTSSKKNESSLFPTWFRSLSIAYICEFLNIEGFNFVKSPGY